MSLKQPFRPTGGATVNIDVASTTANVALPPSGQVRVMNNGTATAWINFGTDNTVTATVAAGIPIGPGVTEVLSNMTTTAGAAYVAAIAAAATGKIYFTPGAGV